MTTIHRFLDLIWYLDYTSVEVTLQNQFRAQMCIQMPEREHKRTSRARSLPEHILYIFEWKAIERKGVCQNEGGTSAL